LHSLTHFKKLKQQLVTVNFFEGHTDFLSKTKKRKATSLKTEKHDKKAWKKLLKVKKSNTFSWFHKHLTIFLSNSELFYLCNLLSKIVVVLRLLKTSNCNTAIIILSVCVKCFPFFHHYLCNQLVYWEAFWLWILQTNV